uniref:Uncharacterized protein n=1 Tax=Arundo donax TaxID=35708 RepID=A0A0A9FJH2_ARUDO
MLVICSLRFFSSEKVVFHSMLFVACVFFFFREACCQILEQQT